jgi:hypothetical protein
MWRSRLKFLHERAIAAVGTEAIKVTGLTVGALVKGLPGAKLLEPRASLHAPLRRAALVRQESVSRGKADPVQTSPRGLFVTPSGHRAA